MLVACLLTGGPDRVISVGGRDYRFEDHPRLGPCPMTDTGKERDLSPRHAFWTAATRWYEEGKQIGADGRCVWTPAPDPHEGAVHIGGRDWLLKGSFDAARMLACPGCKRCRGPS